MSRGLGKLQVVLKEVLTRSFEAGFGPLRFADIRGIMAVEHDGDPEAGDKLRPSVERSLRRALKTLVDRGDVLIRGGQGGPGDPRRYITVESFAGTALGGLDKVKDTAHAKATLAEMLDAVRKVEEGGGMAAFMAKAMRSTAKSGRARQRRRLPKRKAAAKAKRAKRRRRFFRQSAAAIAGIMRLCCRSVTSRPVPIFGQSRPGTNQVESDFARRTCAASLRLLRDRHHSIGRPSGTG